MGLGMPLTCRSEDAGFGRTPNPIYLCCFKFSYKR